MSGVSQFNSITVIRFIFLLSFLANLPAILGWWGKEESYYITYMENFTLYSTWNTFRAMSDGSPAGPSSTKVLLPLQNNLLSTWAKDSLGTTHRTSL